MQARRERNEASRSLRAAAGEFMRAVLLPSRHRHAMHTWIARARAWRIARDDARCLTEQLIRMAFLIWQGHTSRCLQIIGHRLHAISHYQIGSIQAAWGAWAAWAATCRHAQKRERQQKRATLGAAWRGWAAHTGFRHLLIRQPGGFVTRATLEAAWRGWAAHAAACRADIQTRQVLLTLMTSDDI